MIKIIEPNEYEICYKIINTCFTIVADELKITQANCPGHSAHLDYNSFLNKIKSTTMYGLFLPELVGCIGIEKKSDVRYKIKYLSVDPKHQHKGYGKLLMDHMETVASNKLQLGMIYEHTVLFEWYCSLGYEVDKIATYKKNAFKVAYMEKRLHENI